MSEKRRRAAGVIQRHFRGTHVRAQLKQQHKAAELLQVTLKPSEHPNLTLREAVAQPCCHLMAHPMFALNNNACTNMC